MVFTGADTIHKALSTMFIALLLVTLVVAALCSTIVVMVFRTPLNAILNRIVSDELGFAWAKYLSFAIYVVGISGGVRIYDLERYVEQPRDEWTPPVLTIERWILEVYRTIIESLQAIALLLLAFFVAALIAFVIVRAFELKRERAEQHAATRNPEARP